MCQKTFVLVKQGHIPSAAPIDPTIGDQHTCVAFDEETKLVPTFVIGKRTAEVTTAFARDLSERIVSSRLQISTDGFAPYKDAIRSNFGEEALYGQIIKLR